MLVSGLVLFSGISLFSFFFLLFECNCECAHHLERVLLEVISSQHHEVDARQITGMIQDLLGKLQA